MLKRWVMLALMQVFRVLLALMQVDRILLALMRVYTAEMLAMPNKVVSSCCTRFISGHIQGLILYSRESNGQHDPTSCPSGSSMTYATVHVRRNCLWYWCFPWILKLPSG